MRTIIYYFTGTGNSLAIARQLADKLPGAELRSLTAACREGKLDLEAEAVGFVYPVYFLGIPLAFRQLLENVIWPKGVYTFAVANFGSMPGSTLHQTAALIAAGGGRLDAGFLIRMPDNYLLMFPAPSQSVQQRDFAALQQRVPVIAAEIAARKHTGIEPSKLRIDRFLTPLMYPTVYKFKEMARNFWITDSCNGCGICAQSCPFGNLEMAAGKPQWQHHCEMCLRCIHICPQKAIQYKKTTVKKGRYHHPNVTVGELMADGNPEFAEKPSD